MSAAFTSLILIMGFIVVYMLLVEIYTVLFRITGLTKEKARFQTISLLTSCGFTTKESEVISSNKTRKKIAAGAMITGYTFSVVIVSLVINLLLQIKVNHIKSSLGIVAIAFGSFILLLVLLRIPFIENIIEKLIEKLAGKFIRSGKSENFITLLDNYGKQAICEIYINRLPKMFKDKTLEQSLVKEKYDLNFLMLKRKEKVIDVTKDSMLQEKDVIVVFGQYQNIKAVFEKVEIEQENEQSKPENRLELIDNYNQDAMIEVTVKALPKFMQNSTLSECGLKAKYDINVLMIRRGNDSINVNESSSIEVGDSIIVFGPYKNIKAVFEIISND